MKNFQYQCPDGSARIDVKQKASGKIEIYISGGCISYISVADIPEFCARLMGQFLVKESNFRELE